MIPSSKKLATIASLIGGLAYLSQHYTVDGWQSLRIEPVSSTASDNSGRGSLVSSNDRSPEFNFPFRGLPERAIPFTDAATARSPYPAPSSGITSLLPAVSHAAQQLASTKSFAPAGQPSSLKPPTLKVASFNMQRFGHHKAENPFVMETVIKIIKQFEVIALQEICTQQQDLLPLIVDRVNQAGFQYDFLIGPRVGDNQEQFAFVFDTTKIETDRDQLYTVDDPDNLLRYEPLVGWFRYKQTDAQKAFTFTLVNFHCNADRAEAELRCLPGLIQSIQRDGRREDDIIIAGDFGSDIRSLAFLRSKGLSTALDGTSTMVSGTGTQDNLLMMTRSTDEFVGRAGVLDFLRKSNLTVEQALQVSDHLPIWAEFFVIEGGGH